MLSSYVRCKDCSRTPSLVLSSCSAGKIFSIPLFVFSSMAFQFQYLPFLNSGSNFLIAFSENEPYSLLNGGNFLNASTNDVSSKRCLVAKDFKAFSYPVLSVTEYIRCQSCCPSSLVQ